MTQMKEYSINENSREHIDFNLSYGARYSDAAKRPINGVPQKILTADTQEMYLYIKRSLSDATPLIELNIGNGGLSWLGATNGKLRANFGSNTNGKAGDNMYYELKAKWLDSTFSTLEVGKIHIRNSVVDAPTP